MACQELFSNRAIIFFLTRINPLWYRSSMQNMTIPQIAEKAGVHPDTIYKAARAKRASFKLAEKLEEVTGINKLQFQYPDQFGDGWALLPINKDK